MSVSARPMSQEDIILGVLSEHANSWVAMPYLYGVSGSMACHSRIAELRSRGYKIVNRVDRSHRPYASFYMLIKEGQQ